MSKGLFRTNSTLRNVDLMPQGHPQTEAERRLITQYRRMTEMHGSHNRPFTIVFVFNGEEVSIYSGAPSGRIDK